MATTAVDPPQAEFGKYHLLRKLAQGGMAEIFLANQRGIKGFEKLVVLKRVLPELSASDDFVEMFLDEARIAARLDHPNIVRINDLGEVNGQYYIAMEYIAGEDQASVIQQARRLKLAIPLEYAADVVIGAAEALTFAHEMEDAQGNPMRLVHRDVSPSNIIFTWQGAAKLVDFGIARAESNVAKTAGGQVKGKIQYLSPEQARGERADSRSDLFALGITLYELITGQRLFQRETPLGTMNAILKSEVPQLDSVRPGVPPDLEQIMRKALMTDPEMRYQTGAEMAADLTVWLANSGWIRGTRSVEYLTRLFGEDRKRAKLKVARGQHLDEAGYAAMASLPQDPSARPHSGSHDAHRPPTPLSGAHHRPPSQPSAVIRTPAPPTISPLAAPRRPSYPQLPQIGTPRPGPTAPALGAAPVSPSGKLPALQAEPEDEDDSEMMRTMAAGDVTELLRKSAEARGAPGAGASGPPPARPSQLNLPAVAPLVPPAQLSPPSIAPVARPSQPNLAAAAAAATRPLSQPNLSDPGGAPAPAPPVEASAPVLRPASSNDLAEAAAALAARLAPSASAPQAPPVSEQRPFAPAKKASVGRLLLVLLVAAALGAGALYVFRNRAPQAPAPTPPPVVIEPPAPPGPAPVGRLRFEGVPPGARVTLDGQLISNPDSENSFAPGKHLVVVDAQGQPRFERTIELIADQVQLVKVELRRAGEKRR